MERTVNSNLNKKGEGFWNYTKKAIGPVDSRFDYCPLMIVNERQTGENMVPLCYQFINWEDSKRQNPRGHYI